MSTTKTKRQAAPRAPRPKPQTEEELNQKMQALNRAREVVCAKEIEEVLKKHKCQMIPELRLVGGEPPHPFIHFRAM